MSYKKNLNLGCGSHYHKDWINVDFNSHSKEVIAHNLLKGIPFESNSIDVIYNSHVLEHFSKNEARVFLQECFRALKPNGTIRICIPDMENLAKTYLNTLERCLNGEKEAKADYEWIMNELLDQCTRTTPGGEMFEYFKLDITNEAFVRQRLGNEVSSIKQASRNFQPIKPIKKFKIKYWVNKIKELILGEDKKYIEEAKFRSGGELHKWMYDRYSIKFLLEACGFSNVKFYSYNQSSISDWNNYKLDIFDEIERRPNSLYVEAQKL